MWIRDRMYGGNSATVADVGGDGAEDLVVIGRDVGSIRLALGGADRIIGENTCGPAAHNSSGLDGRMSARGSGAVSAADARITADRLPAGAFGYFLASRTLSPATPVAGSSGFLCLAGDVGRLNQPGQTLQVSGAGRMTLLLDLAALPTPTGFVAAAVGETWGFQAWHRDAGATQPTSNFTDAIAITWE